MNLYFGVFFGGLRVLEKLLKKNKTFTSLSSLSCMESKKEIDLYLWVFLRGGGVS